MNNLFRRILNLLLPGERRKALRVSVSVFVNALLDFIGLASLMPILYYLLEDSAGKDAVLVFCAIAIGVFLLKFLVSTRLSRYQTVFLLGLYRRLSYSLYSSYFRNGLLFIRKKGVSKLGYEVNAVCYAFSQSILAPLLKMAGDSLLIMLFMSAVLVYSPATALVLFVSFIPFALVYVFVIRKRAKVYGRMEQEAKREQARIVHDSFGGYAELQVNDAFASFTRQFMDGMDTIVESRMKMISVQRLPMFFSELAVVLGLTLLCLLGDGDVTVLIGIFAVAAFRLLPAVRSILSGWTVIQNAEYSLDIIEQGLTEEVVTEEEEIGFVREIRFEDISYSYPEGGKVLKDFNLSIAKGEYIGFRGDSGAGKSTLFNILMGFITPAGGKVLIDDVALEEGTRRSWLKKVGYVAQDVFIFNSSLAENIALGVEVDKERINEILASLNMDEWLSEQEGGLDVMLTERGENLSGGQRQRIGIARALYRDIDVLLLDEASSSLDNETEKEMLVTLERLRKDKPELTILSIAHRESSLADCDRIVKI